jgi:hypothetical protein
MPATYPPTPKVEIAFATDPLATSPTWTDVSAYVKSIETKRGRSHELGRVEAGVGTLELDDADRRFDPLNTSSPYSPNVLPLKKVRVTLDDTVTQFRVFTGYIERWPLKWDAPGYTFDRAVGMVDGFEFLAQNDLVTSRATLTTSFGGNADLTFTSRGAGAGGNGISVEYVVNPYHTMHHTVAYLASEVEAMGPEETERIIVSLGTSAPGTPNADARHVRAAVRANPAVDALVEVSLPSSSSGHDFPDAMARTFLTGGEYEQELSSTRIGNVLDDIGFPSGASHRAIETGQSLVAEAGWVENDEQKALEHIQSTADAEGGVFFMDGEGKAVFHDRLYRWEGAQITPVCTFGDGGGSEIPYETISANFDRDEITNDARVSYARNATPAEYEDVANQATYGHRTIKQDLALVTSTEAESRAQYLVEAFKNPKLRVDKISVQPVANATAWAALLGLEIGDRVTVKRRPAEHPTGGAVVISVDCFVESIEVSIGAVGEETTYVLGLTPAPWASFWILGDSTYGVLDSTTRLGY